MVQDKVILHLASGGILEAARLFEELLARDRASKCVEQSDRTTKDEARLPGVCCSWSSEFQTRITSTKRGEEESGGESSTTQVQSRQVEDDERRCMGGRR